MDNGAAADGHSTPKKRAGHGPIFDESEFEPSNIRLQVHQSALNQNGQQQQQVGNQDNRNTAKRMTRHEHAKLMREQK